MSHWSAGGEGGEGGPAGPGGLPGARGATGGNGSGGGGGGGGGAGTVGPVGHSADTFSARGSDATWSRESNVLIMKRGTLLCHRAVHHHQFVFEY